MMLDGNLCFGRHVPHLPQLNLRPVEDDVLIPRHHGRHVYRVVALLLQALVGVVEDLGLGDLLDLSQVHSGLDHAAAVVGLSVGLLLGRRKIDAATNETTSARLHVAARRDRLTCRYGCLVVKCDALGAFAGPVVAVLVSTQTAVVIVRFLAAGHTTLHCAVPGQMVVDLAAPSALVLGVVDAAASDAARRATGGRGAAAVARRVTALLLLLTRYEEVVEEHGCSQHTRVTHRGGQGCIGVLVGLLIGVLIGRLVGVLLASSCGGRRGWRRRLLHH